MAATIIPVSAGHYYSDAGAFMGVLPFSMWGKKLETDDRRRVRMNLNLLLIRLEHNLILIDTGLGNRLTDKQKDIYNPSGFELMDNLRNQGISPADISDVIITHLHFDHAGGIVSQIGNHEDDITLTFPNAVYHIQEKEWRMAWQPDALNKAAYQAEKQLTLLRDNGLIHLINGDCTLYHSVYLHLTGGHTDGMQIVEIEGDEHYIYAGDIIPTTYHQHMPVMSAYDVSRKDTYLAKEMIYRRLKEKNGSLLLGHDTAEWSLPISSINV